jgi:hypothetical protein
MMNYLTHFTQNLIKSLKYFPLMYCLRGVSTITLICFSSSKNSLYEPLLIYSFAKRLRKISPKRNVLVSSS